MQRLSTSGVRFRWAQRLCGLDITPPAGAAAASPAAQADAPSSALDAHALLQRLAALPGP